MYHNLLLIIYLFGIVIVKANSVVSCLNEHLLIYGKEIGKIYVELDWIRLEKARKISSKFKHIILIITK